MNIKSHEYKNIGETYKSAVLSNGLEIRVLEKPEFRTYFAAFAVNYGGADMVFRMDGMEYSTPAGIAHFLEHKMFDMPDGTDVFSAMSATGADPNAFTSSEMTCYYFSCTEQFEKNLRLLIAFVTTPFFTDDTVEKEKPIISQEIMMGLDNPGRTLYYNFLKLLYRNHPVKVEVAGTAESISGITADTLYKCHQTFYCPGNMILCVEGNIKAEDVVAIAEETLSGWESASVPEPDYGEGDGVLPYETSISAAAEISAPQFIIGSKILPSESDRTRQQLTAKLAVLCVFGPSSAFYNRLYSSGLINRSFSWDVDYVCDTAMVSLSGESPDPDAVLNEVCAEIDRVKALGIEPGLFRRIKKASIGGALRSFEDFETVCIGLAEGHFHGSCPFDGPEILEKISVEECVAFLTEYFAPERLAMSVIHP